MTILSSWHPGSRDHCKGATWQSPSVPESGPSLPLVHTHPRASSAPRQDRGSSNLPLNLRCPGVNWSRFAGSDCTPLSYGVARVMGAPIPVFLERLAGRSRATVVVALPQCRSDLAERGTLPDARAVAGRLGRGQVTGFGRSPVAVLDRKEASQCSPGNVCSASWAW